MFKYVNQGLKVWQLILKKMSTSTLPLQSRIIQNTNTEISKRHPYYHVIFPVAHTANTAKLPFTSRLLFRLEDHRRLFAITLSDVYKFKCYSIIIHKIR